MRRKLINFLVDGFSRTELARVADHFGVARSVGGRNESDQAYGAELVRALERRGLIDDGFFEHLIEGRAHREPEIRALQASWWKTRPSGVTRRARTRPDMRTLEQLWREIEGSTPLRRQLRDAVIQRAFSGPTLDALRCVASGEEGPPGGLLEVARDIAGALGGSKVEEGPSAVSAVDLLQLLRDVQRQSPFRRATRNVVLQVLAPWWHPALRELADRPQQTGAPSFDERAELMLRLEPSLVVALCGRKGLNDEDGQAYFDRYYHWAAPEGRRLLRLFWEETPRFHDHDGKPNVIARVVLANAEDTQTYRRREVGLVVFLYPDAPAAVLLHAMQEGTFFHAEYREPSVVQAALKILRDLAARADEEVAGDLSDRLSKAGWSLDP